MIIQSTYLVNNVLKTKHVAAFLSILYNYRTLAKHGVITFFMDFSTAFFRCIEKVNRELTHTFSFLIYHKTRFFS